MLQEFADDTLRSDLLSRVTQAYIKIVNSVWQQYIG